MDNLCRQTYIFLALKAALSDLKIQNQNQQMEELLVNILKNKIEEYLDQTQVKKHTKQGNTINCRQIIDKEYPLESENSSVMKYSSLIYDVAMNPTLKKKLKIKGSVLCFLEFFSDHNFSKKEQRQLKNEKITESIQIKNETRHHKQLKSKVLELIKTQKSDLSKKKKEQEKQKRREAKELVLKEPLIKKKKLY